VCSSALSVSRSLRPVGARPSARITHGSINLDQPASR
jgi:hypothetical protein